jgi:alkylation response protein AidB-like acyl-CoA dehydrogenase
MGDVDLSETQTVFGEVQAAKSFMADAALRVVDRSLALSGGAGYRSEHPLSQAWRDVRATAFMYPLGANRVDAFLARTALGRPPT